MKLNSILVKETAIVFDVDRNPAKGDSADFIERPKVSCPHRPTDAFTAALQNLDSVVCEVMEVGAKWKSGVKVTGFTVTRTDAGTRSVKIGFTRHFKITDSSKKLETLAVQIDDPKGADSTKRELKPAMVELVETAIDEAERYANGERQQMLLSGIDDDDNQPADDENQGTLPNT